MGFYIFGFRFSVRQLVFLSALSVPHYFWKQRSLRKFIAELDKQEDFKRMQLLEAQTQFKNMDANVQYRDLVSRDMVALNDLEGDYRLIVFGDALAFQRFKQQEIIKKSPLKFTLVVDREEEDQRLSSLGHVLVGSDVQKQFYLVNKDQEVLLHDNLSNNMDDQYISKMASVIKVQINKDVEKRLLQELKF